MEWPALSSNRIGLGTLTHTPTGGSASPSKGADMRQLTTTIYEYDELSEEAKATALNALADINLHPDWYECIYDDADRIGLSLTGFDLDHGQIAGRLQGPMRETVEKILTEHGYTCDTYQLALSYQLPRPETDEEEEDYQRQTEEFQQALLEEYFCILRKEYESLGSREQVEDTIRCNGYEFNEHGGQT